jgi:citrate lyase subunit beta/citryl-CoA lyase
LADPPGLSAGKLLIHPAQLEAARSGFRPGEEKIAWASDVLAASADGSAVALNA